MCCARLGAAGAQCSCDGWVLGCQCDTEMPTGRTLLKREGGNINRRQSGIKELRGRRGVRYRPLACDVC